MMAIRAPKKELKNRGFTILELMIATTVFSVILLIVTFSILQIGRLYYKGLNQSRVQNTSRSVMDGLINAIQYGASEPQGLVTSGPTAADSVNPIPGNAAEGVMCIGNQRFTYQTTDTVKDSPGAGERFHGLVQDTFSGPCVPNPEFSSAALTVTKGRELLAENTRLYSISVGQNGSAYMIAINVSLGPDDLIIPPAGFLDSAECRSTDSGGQFCANAFLFTEVQRRL